MARNHAKMQMMHGEGFVFGLCNWVRDQIRSQTSQTVRMHTDEMGNMFMGNMFFVRVSVDRHCGWRRRMYSVPALCIGHFRCCVVVYRIKLQPPVLPADDVALSHCPSTGQETTSRLTFFACSQSQYIPPRPVCSLCRVPRARQRYIVLSVPGSTGRPLKRDASRL
jgi:hypothetical protein